MATHAPTRICREELFNETWLVQWDIGELRAAAQPYIMDLGLIEAFPSSTDDGLVLPGCHARLR